MLARSLRAQPCVPSSGPLAKYTVRDGMLLSGVLSWLGFSPEPEPEHDLIMTIKRGILAAQVETFLFYCFSVEPFLF